MDAWWATWSSYRPADFLMFSPEIYWRLFGSLNRAWWPAQLPWLVAAGLWLWRNRSAPTGLRAGALALALAWGLGGWAFVATRYAPIQWAAEGFALGFYAQALLLGAWAATSAGKVVAATGVRRRIGVALGAWALLLHPLLAPASGRPWAQAEVFGLAPDPTTIGTLAFLLLLRGGDRAARLALALLWPLPLAWCLTSAATLLTMGAAQGGLPLAAAALALLALRWRADPWR